MVDLETALDILGIECQSKESIRKAYLKKALEVHPDKQNRVLAGDEKQQADSAFATLHDAYCVAMEHCSKGTWVQDEDVLVRAFRGEDVDSELRRAGVFRPDPMFGINVNVPFHTLTQQCDSVDDDAREKIRKELEDILSYEEDT